MTLVAPHGGGSLRQLLLPEPQRADARQQASGMARVRLSSREYSDLLMIGMGAYTPLDGFMGHDDWLKVCRDMRLTHGLFWPIPITLSQEASIAKTLKAGDDIALMAPDDDEIVATLRVRETYRIDKAFECRHVFRTTDPAHPGVAKVMRQGEVNIAGPVRLLTEGSYAARYPDLYMRPVDSRAEFQRRGWRQISAFQTRNPMHRSHEHLTKIAAEVSDGVFIHQVLGKLKDGDLPVEVRAEAIRVVLDTYFKPGIALQAGYPIEMRYAGPREALMHALIRQNFGCTHLVVGRDHAGIGSYYGPYDAQTIFDELWDGALMCKPLKIGVTFYCRKCAGMATEKTCPHGDGDHVEISGTRQRQMLEEGEPIPPEFSRPEVAAILRSYYAKQRREGRRRPS